MSLRVIPLTLREANNVVARLHRHHKPVRGHRFSIGVVDGTGRLRGVAIIGRPVARMVDHRMVCEVSRVATDGVHNGCSLLLGAAARAARAMGYFKIQTYTLPAEGGASLRGAGWHCEGQAGGGQWEHTDGRPRRTDQPTDVKHRWTKTLASPVEYSAPALSPEESPQLDLFGSESSAEPVLPADRGDRLDAEAHKAASRAVQ